MPCLLGFLFSMTPHILNWNIRNNFERTLKKKICPVCNSLCMHYKMKKKYLKQREDL